MANPWTGEVEIWLNGERHLAKLTLGALAELEAEINGSVIEIVRRFESGGFSARDVLALLLAGLRGGGWQGTAEDLRGAEIAGGPMRAAQIAAALLVRAFSLPGQEEEAS